MNYSEEDDTYVTDIEILSISNSKEVIYPEDIEV